MSRNSSFHSNSTTASIAAAFYNNEELLRREIEELAREGTPASIPASASVLAGYVEFDQSGFEFHAPGINEVGGVRAFLFLICDCYGNPKDIVAWAPLISRLESWHGTSRLVEAEKAAGLKQSSRLEAVS